MYRNKNVAEKVAATLTELKKEGYYDKLFDKYGLTKLPVDTFVIRGPGPQ
jgi:polar amino acid transport system substrate-binding protein